MFGGIRYLDGDLLKQETPTIEAGVRYSTGIRSFVLTSHPGQASVREVAVMMPGAMVASVAHELLIYRTIGGMQCAPLPTLFFARSL